MKSTPVSHEARDQEVDVARPVDVNGAAEDVAENDRNRAPWMVPRTTSWGVRKSWNSARLATWAVLVTIEVVLEAGRLYRLRSDRLRSDRLRFGPVEVGPVEVGPVEVGPLRSA